MLEQQQAQDAGGTPSVSWAPDVGPFLVAWDLQADQGMAQVLLLARAAHCLQRLHALDTARQPVAGTDEWQVCLAAGWARFCAVSEAAQLVSGLNAGMHLSYCVTAWILYMPQAK